jgi:hypothetical protein
MSSRTVANSRIVARERSNQRFVLAQRDTGHAPDAAIGRACYAEARAGDRSVMGPRIVLERVEQPRQFGEQGFINVLKRAASMKRIRQELAVLIKSNASKNRVSAGLEGGKIFRDPNRRHSAVSVRGQDHAIPVAFFHQPSLGQIHRRPTRGASMCGRRRQSRFNDAEIERQTCANPSREARTLIGAIVGEHNHADQLWRNWPPETVVLPRESTQTVEQASLFVFGGDSDDKAW